MAAVNLSIWRSFKNPCPSEFFESVMGWEGQSKPAHGGQNKPADAAKINQRIGPK